MTISGKGIMNIFENYTKLYPISKTLRFKLIPQFETEENIKKYDVLLKDENRAEEYQRVKELFDKCHKAYLEKVLAEKVDIDWVELKDVLIKSQKEKSDDFKLFTEKSRKDLSKHLKNNELYKALAPSKIVDSVIQGNFNLVEFTNYEIESIKKFNKFTSYFIGYSETRDNIYDEKQGSVSYRLINENFPKFINNIKIVNSLDSALLNEANTELKELTGGLALEDIFKPEYYEKVLTQKGIEFYNTLLGGISENENVKVKGLNEFLNLKYQQGVLLKKIKLAPLYKQILSEREKASFIPESLLNDAEVIKRIKTFSEELNGSLDKNISELETVIASAQTDDDKIYIDKKQIPFLSQILFNNQWNAINTLIYENKLKESSVYTLSFLNDLTQKEISAEVLSFFKDTLSDMRTKYTDMTDRFPRENNFDDEKISSFDNIKAYLDSVQQCEKVLKIFAASEDLDRDIVFYSAFDVLYNAFRSNIPLYNMVRNYATKKPYSTEKYKLNFETPTLAAGWDQNKEKDNHTLLFIKDNNYFLAILNAKNKPKIKECETPSDGAYQKMVYKLLPGPNKMLPKVFFCEKGLAEFKPSKYILDGYKAEKHKKGKNFDIEFCHELIDFFKQAIAKHKDWSKFNFKFSDTSSYNDIGEFYAEISEQNYKLSFSYVDAKQLEELVKEGKVFLFQIYNKDFSNYSKGKQNLHTLYWKQLFSEENLKEPLFKLNGEAELFYRPASIKSPFVHKKGSVLISKNDKNKAPVSDKLYEEATIDANNGMSLEKLSAKYPTLVFKVAEYDIVKDKRYSKAEFSFHVPITLNYGCKDVSKNINKMVLEDVAYSEDINIIGIDRGERNLIYVSVINQKGELIEQKSYNVITNSVSTVDYHKKLDNIEKERDQSRKDWKQISNIKEVKEGYLSAVIKEIADMMIKYNAIIAMEDLNFGFKRGRFHIEKQVYQKFEKMLIDKLNYFADKNLEISSFGSIRNGYQLTPKFESFQKIGKHSGFIFYVPSAYTSKIDPITGFVNLFNSTHLSYHSKKQAKAFIETFDKICFDNDFDCFRFDFRYSNFDLTNDYQDSWQVYSCGNGRIAYTKRDSANPKETIDVTQRLKDLLERYGIDYTSEDLKNNILEINDETFFKELLWLFKVIVQIRYEDADNDFILSPVQNDGVFFDSRKADEQYPCDGDANGAYHIALQGLRLIKTRIQNGKIVSDEKNKQNYNWFEFVQTKAYK